MLHGHDVHNINAGTLSLKILWNEENGTKIARRFHLFLLKVSFRSGSFDPFYSLPLLEESFGNAWYLLLLSVKLTRNADKQSRLNQKFSQPKGRNGKDKFHVMENEKRNYGAASIEQNMILHSCYKFIRYSFQEMQNKPSPKRRFF